MYMVRSWKPAGVLVALAVAIGVAACGGDDGGGESGEKVELSFFVANSEQAVLPAEALIAAFEKKNPEHPASTSRRARRAPSSTTWSRRGSPPAR